MENKKIANEKVSINVSSLGAWTPDPSPELILNKSLKSGANKNNPILHTKINTNPKNCTMSGYTFLGGSGVINASSIKCFTDNNKKIMRDKDVGVCTGSFQQTAQPFSTVICTCKLKINDPGQDKVRGK